MTKRQRYAVECLGATALVCLGLVLLVGERVALKARRLVRR
jgi:hypothetical protein